MSGDHTSTSIQSIIQDFEDIEGIMLKQNIDDNGDWYPANPQILHWMHKMYISQNAITQISGNINTKTTDKEHNVPHFQYRQYAYDSILQDIEMQYRTPLHRRALMATLNEHIAWKKFIAAINPIKFPKVKFIHVKQDCRILDFGVF